MRKGWEGKGGLSAYNRGLVGAAETSPQRNGGGGGGAREGSGSVDTNKVKILQKMRREM